METKSMENVSSSSQKTLRVDTHLAKFSQAATVVLSGLAFLFNQPIIVVITAIIMILSALTPDVSPYRLLYKGVVLPLRLLKPRIAEDDPAPHRFAQGVGAVFLIASSIVLLLTHVTVLG